MIYIIFNWLSHWQTQIIANHFSFVSSTSKSSWAHSKAHHIKAIIRQDEETRSIPSVVISKPRRVNKDSALAPADKSFDFTAAFSARIRRNLASPGFFHHIGHQFQQGLHSGSSPCGINATDATLKALHPNSCSI